MTDVLERLRDDNPVSAGSAPPIDEVWARLDREPAKRHRPLHLARTLVLALIALAPVVGVVALVLTARGRSRPSPTDAAGAVIVHYHAVQVYSPAADSGASFAYEVTVSDVWLDASLRHRVDTIYVYSRTNQRIGVPSHVELASDGRRLQSFQAGSLDPAGTIVESQAAMQDAPCPLIVYCAGAVSVDPVSELRRLYRTGELVLAARRVLFNQSITNELITRSTSPVVKVFVKPGSFVPVDIGSWYGSSSRPSADTPVTSTMISDYQRLPATASNLRLLRMQAHPRAHPMCGGTGGGGPEWPPAGARGCASSPVHPRATPATGPARMVAHIELSAPGARADSRSPAGVADLYRTGAGYLVRITATGVAPSSAGRAYAVWLAAAPNKSRLLGFVSPGVGPDRRLSTEGELPATASTYQRLLVTLEHTANPRHPGMVVLEGTWRM
jgi:hypothetical protein